MFQTKGNPDGMCLSTRNEFKIKWGVYLSYNHTDFKLKTYLQGFNVRCFNLNIFFSLAIRKYTTNVPLDPPQSFGALAVLPTNKISVVPK